MELEVGHGDDGAGESARDRQNNGTVGSPRGQRDDGAMGCSLVTLDDNGWSRGQQDDGAMGCSRGQQDDGAMGCPQAQQDDSGWSRGQQDDEARGCARNQQGDGAIRWARCQQGAGAMRWTRHHQGDGVMRWDRHEHDDGARGWARLQHNNGVRGLSRDQEDGRTNGWSRDVQDDGGTGWPRHRQNAAAWDWPRDQPDEGDGTWSGDQQHEESRSPFRVQDDDETWRGPGPGALELSRGTVALCQLYYIWLQKERRLREQEQRRRRTLFRRMKAKQKLRFVALWFSQVLSSGSDSRALGRDRRIWSKARSSALWDTVIARAFTSFDWTENFRMNKATFDYLCGQLRQAIQQRDTKLRRAIPVEVRLAMTLWRLGACCEYLTIEKLFGISRSTVSKIIRDVCQAIVDILTPRYVCVPSGPALQDVLSQLEERYGLPQLAGMVDVLHIPIQASNENTINYCNSKDWHSMILQAVVDGQYCFWDINIGSPGSVSDAQVLVSSELYDRATRGTLFPNNTKNIAGTEVPIHLLGDLAYPFLPWLMKPYPDACENVTPAQRNYNQHFFAARLVVNGTFCRLRCRWRCLLKSNNMDVAFLPTLVAACCTLHNICELHGDSFNLHWMEEASMEEDLEQPSEEAADGEPDAEDLEAARKIRNALTVALQTKGDKLGPAATRETRTVVKNKSL